MTRLLGRSLSRRKDAERTDEQYAPEGGRRPAVSGAAAPVKPSTRRRRSSNTAALRNGVETEPTPIESKPEARRSSNPAAESVSTEASNPSEQRGRSRAATARNGADSESVTDEIKSTRRRFSPRRESTGVDPQAAMLDAIQRQTVLLERQTELIESQQNALTRLTDAMLGQRRGGDRSHGAQVEVQPRLAIFVDVPNILYAAEATKVELNWGKVAAFLSEGRTLVRAIAYAPISDDPNARTENERFVVPFLENDYRIATKPLKRFSGGSVKANFDVELAIDVLTMADRVDVIVLVSGDGDFRRLVEIVGSRGVRVEVMAFGQSTSQDLRVVADRYIDIAAYIPELSGR